jgi:hypothetical protein
VIIRIFLKSIQKEKYPEFQVELFSVSAVQTCKYSSCVRICSCRLQPVIAISDGYFLPLKNTAFPTTDHHSSAGEAANLQASTEL